MSALFSTGPPVAVRDTPPTIRSGYALGASHDRQCTHSPTGTEPNGSLRVLQGRVHAESSLRAVDDSVSTVQRRLRSLHGDKDGSSVAAADTIAAFAIRYAEEIVPLHALD